MMVVTMTIKWWWRSKKLGPVAACGLICEQSFCTTSSKKRFCTTGLKLWNFIRFVKKKTIKHFSAALTCLTFSAHWKKTFEQMKRVVCVTNKKVSQLSMKSDDDDGNERNPPQTRSQCTKPGNPSTCKAPQTRALTPGTFSRPPRKWVGQYCFQISKIWLFDAKRCWKELCH